PGREHIMAKQIMFDESARRKIVAGVTKLAKVVKVTLGPAGKNVIIEKSFGGPMVTRDGVSVAKEIELEDPFENMGAKLVQEVSKKTNDVAGDGTRSEERRVGSEGSWGRPAMASTKSGEALMETV